MFGKKDWDFSHGASDKKSFHEEMEAVLFFGQVHIFFTK